MRGRGDDTYTEPPKLDVPGPCSTYHLANLLHATKGISLFPIASMHTRIELQVYLFSPLFISLLSSYSNLYSSILLILYLLLWHQYDPMTFVHDDS